MVWLIFVCFVAMIINQILWSDYSGDAAENWEEDKPGFAYWLVFENVTVHLLGLSGIVIALIKIIG